MKTETRKVYRCEFCGKHYIHKGWAKYHEKWCRKNPRFIVNCINCVFLDEKALHVCEPGKDYDFEKTYNVPYCKKGNGKYMYHPRLERLKTFKERGFPEQTCMPKDCKDFKGDSYDIFKINRKKIEE